MKILINKHIKRDEYGNYMQGHVHFYSLPTNDELDKYIHAGLQVNLSKSLNPSCDTAIEYLQSHNNHAGTFTSQVLLDEYVQRVSQKLIQVVSEYNMSLEDAQSTDPLLEHVTTMYNNDLAPVPNGEMTPFIVTNMETLSEMMGMMAESLLIFDEVDVIEYDTEEDDE